MNTNTPSSTVICGVQGAGKSHSVAVMIENALIQSNLLGRLPNPMSVTVFHLGAAQSGMHLPCEFAFIGRPDPRKDPSQVGTPVTVLVSPSNLKSMTKLYAHTGAKILPFYLSTEDLNCTRMLSLMHVEESNGIPLYMQVVQQILRDMGNKPFDYPSFKAQIDLKKSTEFRREQSMPLELRLQLLEAFLLECQPALTRCVPSVRSVKSHFKGGAITIIDLTDPFINASSASALFDIALSLYLETDIPSGKLLVLDEAHKVVFFYIPH
jgi:hypothetical protein